MWCGLFSQLLSVSTPIQAFAFNFTKLPGPFKRALFAAALRRINTLVVASEMERDLYARAFLLEKEKIIFQYWSTNPPHLTQPPTLAGAYVSAIGGNSRDYRALIGAAMLLPDTIFCIVARSENLVGLTIPPNVRVFTNIPFDDAMNILGHSSIMVLPLIGSETPCGHVTIVTAMCLGVPIVATNSSGVSDYIENGRTGLMVDVGRADQIASAVSDLMRNDSTRLYISSRAKNFALRRCSESEGASHFKKWLADVSATGDPSCSPNRAHGQ
jgi:glycosyltransferase involved in cell wall biosynthesis